MARGTSPRPMLRPEGFAVKPTRESSPRPRLRPSDPETTAVMSPETYEAVSDQTEAAFGPAPVSSIEEVEEIRNTPPGFEQKTSLSEIVGDVIDPSSDEKVKKLEDYLAGVGPVQRDPFDEVLSRGWIKAIKNSPYGDKYKSNLNLLSQDGIDTVKGMFKSSLGADPKWDPQKENWCATFVNTVLMGLGADLLQTGDKYDRLRARKYVKYGSPVSRDNLQQGDIVVLDFPRNADGDIDFRDPTAKRDGVGDHVTFYAGDNSGANRPGTGFIGVLGGNQGYNSEIGLTEYSDANILATRRITYNDIDYEFTKELAKENPDFNSFLKEQGEGFDMEAFSNPDPLGFDKGGLAENKNLDLARSYGVTPVDPDETVEALKSVGQVAWESLPGIGTYYTIEDIKEELGKEEPNYYKIGALAGLEVIGLVPGLGDAAVAAIKAGAKKAGLDKLAEQTDAFLNGPKAEDSVKNEMAGFTGQNPPTYIPKDETVFDPSKIHETTSVYNEDVGSGLLRFREPIAEFTRKLTMANSFPSKGITGAEFLRLLEKNAESIPPSSYKEGLVDRDKRYTREELLNAVTKNSTSGLPESIYYNLADLTAPPAFEGYQRQTQVGFTGYPRYPEDTSYFSIPILSRTSGKTFKANSQHFDASTTAHVRGSFIDPLVGFEVNKTLSPEFKNIVGKDRPYLLVEEIQSDLLQKGYRKPKNSFDTAFDKATEEALRGTQTTFQESYGDITNDLKSLVKALDSKNLEMPEEPLRLRPVFRPGALNRSTNTQFKDRRKRDFLDEIASRGTVDGVSYVDFDEIMDYINRQGVNSNHIHEVFRNLVDRANGSSYLYGDDRIAFTGPDGTVYNDIIVSQTNDQGVKKFYVNPDSEDYKKATEAFDYYSRDFGLNFDELLDTYEGEIDEYYSAIGKEIEDRGLDKDIERSLVSNIYENFRENKKLEEALGDQTNTALPPVRKNKQTVEEALKLLIAKADQEGVDKIVIPPASKIAEARGRTIDPSDKGDRFYRTYVADLNKALEDLEKNYPVTIHRDVELPYKNENQPTRTAAEQHLIDMGFEDMVNDNPNAVAANAADDAAINDDDLFTVEEGNQFFDLPEGFFDDVPDQNAPVQGSKTKINTDNKGIIIDISKLREQFQVDKPRQFAEGGTVDMNQQMSFAFEDGGLRDDGMTRDPVSGNEVPPGSTAKEVRDDIPAQLSEGEYVVPADVVRYYGVKFFEDLRDNAKRGLQDMEARGRIGGEPVPAGGPMNEGDLSPEEMAAIQEMMGMAEGGAVNMYKQQQDLYSAPNPAIGNSVNMASGGQVRGYNQAGTVAPATDPTTTGITEQDFLQQGKQAQQSAFVGFPLGATIFPSAQQTTPTVATFEPVNLIHPETFVKIVATTQEMYEQKLDEGYVLDDGSIAPTGTQAAPDDGGTPPPPEESKPAYEDWLNSADFNSEAGIEKFIAGISYDPSKSKLDMQTLGATVMGGPMAGLMTAAGGALRGGGLQAISDMRAASLIAKAQGLDELAGKIDAQVADIIKDGPGILDFLDDIFATGKQKANAWAKTQGHSNIETATEAGITPKPPVTTAPPTPSSEDGPTFTPGDGSRLRDTGTNVGDKAASIQEEAAKTGKSIAEIGRERAPSTAETQTDVEEATGGQGSQGLGSGAGGMNKGGLMATPKKKAKRQYKKGGLANKK